MGQETEFTTDPFAPRSEAETMRKESKEYLHEFKEQGKGFLADQKTRAADIIDDLANALHTSARQMNEQQRPTSARYFDQAAGTLERFSGNLRQRDIEDITYKIKDFARRQPILLIAGTLITGFYLARLMKSGSEQPATMEPSGEHERFTETEVPREIPVH